MASRSLDDLLPGPRAKVDAWLAECSVEIPQPVFITCTYRSQFEQDYLYAQGRDKDHPGPIVTWTRKSKHTERRAVDFALKQPNPWDMKCDVDHDSIPDFIEVGRIAEKHGLQWGVTLKNGQRTDFGHVQDNEVYST